MPSGTPFHFELTLGTVGGSFLDAKMLSARDVGDDLSFSFCCFRCASANCSSATCEGSFRDRNPSTELFFFFLLDDLEPFEEDTLDVVEARLTDVRLAESNDC
jgi:hypothetical protein